MMRQQQQPQQQGYGGRGAQQAAGNVYMQGVMQPGAPQGGPVMSSGGAMAQMGAPGADNEVLRNLMVNYIPTQVDEAYLRQLFETYGPIESVKIVHDKETNLSRGFGFIKYRSAQSASMAINNLNGYPIINKRLKVAYAKAEEAQRALQMMHESSMGGQGQAAGDNNQWLYYMQLQQQMWMQQMMMMQQQNPGAVGVTGAAPAGSIPPHMMAQQQGATPQQQQQQQQQQQHLMMLMQQQQAAQQGAGIAHLQ